MSDDLKDFTEDQKALNPYLTFLEQFRDKRVKKAKDYTVARFTLFCAKQQQFKLANMDRRVTPDSKLDLSYYEALSTPPEAKSDKFSDYDRSQLAFEGYIEKWAVSAEFYQRVTLSNLIKLKKASQTLIKQVASVSVDADQLNPQLKDPTLKQVYIDMKELEKIDPLLTYWDSITAQDLFTLRAGNVVLTTICNFYGLPNTCFDYYTDKIIEDLILSLVRKDQTLKIVRADIPPNEIKRLFSILSTHAFFQIDDYSIYERLRETLIYKPIPGASETHSEKPTGNPEQEATR